MEKAQYGIMRFAKYKGPEIGNIEAHNERTKKKYASNLDVDVSRSNQNFHLVEPKGKYRAEAERQIAEAGCRTRKDSVRVVETLITASPEFFKGKKKAAIKEYFQTALDFIRAHQNPDTILSAVVHMDEKSPHMHLSFVPLTEDGRLSAKDIVGNKKKLTWWQDEFWKHMVKKYPELEHGESANYRTCHWQLLPYAMASQTGRDHIPPRVFKEMTRLNKQRERLDGLLTGMTLLNMKARTEEICKLLDSHIPGVEKMQTQLNKYSTAFTVTVTENKKLKKKNAQLSQSLDKATEESTLKKIADARLRSDYEEAVAVLDRIPPEIINVYARMPAERRSKAHEEVL